MRRLAPILFCSLVLVNWCCLSLCSSCAQASSAASPAEQAHRARNGQSPKAIVSLDATATEWLFAFGLGDRLVARNVQSSHPKEALALPDLGHHSQWSAEGILALRPDLVLVHRDQSALPVVAQIRAVGISVAVLDREPNPLSALAFVRQLGAVIGHEALAEKHAEQLEASLKQRGLLDVGHAATEEGDKPQVLFVYASGGGNVMVGGRDTPIDAMLQLSGAANAAAAVRGYRPLNPEVLMANQADALLLFPHSLDALGGMTGLRQDPSLGLLSAVQKNKVLVLDGLMLTGFGPRLPEAYDTLRAAWDAQDNTASTSLRKPESEALHPQPCAAAQSLGDA